MTKKLAIMQPYFLPYIGYWQLINTVDEFIIYDDVNYISRGYVNRNYINTKTGKQRITLKLKKASINKHINEIIQYIKQKLIKLQFKQYYKLKIVIKLLINLYYFNKIT